MPKRYNSHRSRDSKARQQREIIWRASAGRCHLCDCWVRPDVAWERDHVESQEAAKIAGRQPDNSIANLRVAHSTKYPCAEHGACNQIRGHRPVDYARSMILGTDYQPAKSVDPDFDADPWTSEDTW